MPLPIDDPTLEDTLYLWYEDTISRVEVAA